MPIKKENLERYPKNWRKISWWIIHVRAQNRCEGVYENGEQCQAVNHKLHPITGKTVVLSVAHLDHNPENSDQDLTPEEAAVLSLSNMRAFCQLCHNRWDREHRNQSIKDTYNEKHGIEMPVQVQQELEKLEVFQESLDKSGILIPEEVKDETEEELKEMLQRIIARMPPQEAYLHTILLKSLELRDEYMTLLKLDAKVFSTPQIQAQLTICRSKLAMLDQLRGLHKITANTMNVLRGTTPAEVEPEGITDSNGDDITIRGLGIRKLLEKRKNGDTGSTEI